MEKEENMSMLDKIYLLREEEMNEQNANDIKKLKEKLNKVNLEQIEEALMEKYHVHKDVIKNIELLIENYQLQIAYYSEKNYKVGFKDAFNLCKECKE